MELSKWRRAGTEIALALVLALALALAGCSNTPKPDSELSFGRGAPATPGTARDFAVNVGDIVYFTTDSVDLSPEAEKSLANQVRWLQQYAQYTITIEGHADERGTREYNIALGSRRAQAAQAYLVSRGVGSNRLRIISYGKERPVAVCDDISCWSQNRRAVTLVN
jgi:peptidoglycan-associated lipoprotein